MATPSLLDSQRQFWRALSVTPGMLAKGDRAVRLIAPSPTQRARNRLQVYVDAYYLRLREVLAEDFPRIAAALGEHEFDEFVRRYLTSHPSRHPSLRHLGDRMAEFAATDSASPPWLADLARLERARTDVFDAADDLPLSLDALRAISPEDWPGLQLRTIRALSIVQTQWTVADLWHDAGAVPQAAPGTLRVWRGRDDRVRHAPVSAQAAQALASLAGGACFAALCAAFDDLSPEAAAREAAALLTRWALDGILTR